MIKELSARGLIHNLSHETELDSALKNESLCFYIGFDLTATSLHVGSLIPLTLMKRLSSRGHKPIALLGTGTSKIGDPSGKSTERTLLEESKLQENLTGISTQITDFLGEGSTVVKNGEWLEDLHLIDFLRDIGKHFSVNSMLAKDSVKSRLENREQGISYTEFTYSLLQAYDFLELNKRYNCTLQAGGSDQWGNIVAGLDLIRRIQPESSCYGLTCPLLTTSNGSKFGKTEKGAVWLDPERTSPYEFYQFWLNTADDDIERFLKMFSFEALEDLNTLVEEHRNQPEKRLAQLKLAEEMTALIHGRDEAAKSIAASKTLFGGDVSNLSADELKNVFSEVPSVKLKSSELEKFQSVADLVVGCEILSSKGDAKRLIAGGGLYINSTRVDKPSDSYSLIDDEVILVRTGKKKYHLVVVSP